MGQDAAANFVQTEHQIDTAEFDRFLGHAEDDAGGLVLRQVIGAVLLHLEHPGGAVATHPRKDDADGVSAGVLGD